MMWLRRKPLDGRTVLRYAAMLAMSLVVCDPLSSGPKLLAQSKQQITTADLVLKAEHGPWLILAWTFEGDSAKKNAVQLAAELRRDFKLNAYCATKSFDYTQTLIGAGITPDGEERKMKYRNGKVIESCAVLIGDFSSFDDPMIAKTLDVVKSIQPKFFTKDLSDPNDDSVTAQEYRQRLEAERQRKNKDTTSKKGPMRNAFKTRNPLLPADYYKSPEVDKVVRSFNEGGAAKEYNLLSCPGKFTVRVLTLQGLDSYESWGRSGAKSDSDQKASQLAMAAEQAYLVTKALRAAGYEAYQFHDRYQSIVTVGSFDNLGTSDGKNNFVYDAGIKDVISRFAGTASKTKTNFGESQTPRLLFELVDQKQIPELTEGTRQEQLELFRKLAVPFDLIPMPIAAPKLESTSLYSKYTLGK